MPKVHIPISVEVSEDTADAVAKGSNAVKAIADLVKTAKQTRVGEHVLQAIAAARRAARARPRRG